MSDSYIAPSNPVSRAGAGVVGGLAGGVVLGAALTAFGHIREFAHIAGSSSVAAGWTMLLIVAAVAGCLYGFLVGRSVSAQIVPAVGIGIVYGGACWILIQMVIVPLANNTTVFKFASDSIQVLGSYAAFGVVLGLVYAMAGPRRRLYAPRSRWGYGGGGPWYSAIPRPRRRRRRRASS